MIAKRRTRDSIGLGSLALVLAGSFCAATVLHLATLVAQSPQPPATLPKESQEPQEPAPGKAAGASDKSVNPDEWEAQLLRDLGIEASDSKASRPELQPADAEASQRPPGEAQAVVDLMRSVAGSLRTGSLAPDTLERQRSILQWLDQWFPSTDAPASSDSVASDRSEGSESPSAEKRRSESGSKGEQGSQESESGSRSEASAAGKEGQGGSKSRAMGADGESQELPTDRSEEIGDRKGESGGKSSQPPRQDGGGQAAEGPQPEGAGGDSPDGQPVGDLGDPSSPGMASSTDKEAAGTSAANEEPTPGGQGGEKQGGDRSGAADGASDGPSEGRQPRSSDNNPSQGDDPSAPSSDGNSGGKAGRPEEGDGRGQSGRLAARPSGGGGFQGKLGEPSKGPDGVDQAAWNDPSRLRRGVWGHLPQQVHQQMLAAPSTEFLPSHRKAIEAYYRRLSEAKR
jgi:hypothetical protein